MIDKGHCRANIIHKICIAVLRRRLEQMRRFVFNLKEMSDDDLLREYKKYLP